VPSPARLGNGGDPSASARLWLANGNGADLVPDGCRPPALIAYAMRKYDAALAIEETVDGEEARALMDVYNAAPPPSGCEADRFDIWSGNARSQSVIVVTYRAGCFAPINPSGAPIRIERAAWLDWKGRAEVGQGAT
jgi:hypothetical protein